MSSQYEPWTLPLRKLVALLQEGKLSCRTLMQACLQRIHAVNPLLNAIVQLREEAALAEADRLDQLPFSHRSRKTLYGIPFTLKDMISAKGCCVTAGTLGLRHHQTDADATVTARLKEAGAILLGHTNMPELGMAADTENLVYGRTANPYQLNYSAGGSSGGGAAIVAMGGALFDIGSDTGGSLRIPAHYCGVTTLRPMIGRIPNTGIVPGPRTGFMGLIGTFGPLTRFVEDAALIFNVINGADYADSGTLPYYFITPDKVDCAQLRIAYFLDNGVVAPDVEVTQTILDAVKALQEQGMTVERGRPPQLPEGYALFWELLGAPGIESYNAGVKALGTREVSPFFQRCMDIISDKACDTAELMQRWRRWTLHRSQIFQFMKHYDAVICPVNARPALPQPLSMWDEEILPGFSYTAGISMSGLPAAVVRGGTNTEGLPIGIQILSKPWREDIALAVAGCLEKAFGGWRAPSLCQ